MLEDFDSSNPWTFGGSSPSWSCDAPNKMDITDDITGGGNCLILGNNTPTSTYNDYEDSWAESPVYDLTNATKPYLDFFFYHSNEDHNSFDQIWMEYSTNGGTTWNQLSGAVGTNVCFDQNWYNQPTNWGGYSNNLLAGCDPGGNTGPTGWEQVKKCVSFLAGESNVKFRFRIDAGDFCQGYGATVDNFSVCDANLEVQIDYTCGAAPFEVNFLDASNQCPDSWSWDFGDGNTSTDQNPTHTYDTCGVYTVTLTANVSAAGGAGCGPLSQQIQMDIQVLGIAEELVVQPTCGASDGSIDVEICGNSDPVNYSWTPSGLNGQGTDNVTNIGDGQYDLEITHTIGEGCPATYSTTLSSGVGGNSGVSNTISACGSGVINLFDSLGGSPDQTGTWTGPSVLSGGHLGEFLIGSSATGVYTYTVGTSPCEQTSTITVNPGLSLDPINDASACNTYILPSISGTNLTGNQAYFTGPNGTGTQYNSGDAITTTTTLYAYDTDGSCEAEVSFIVTITGGSMTLDLVAANPLCYGQNNGSVSINVGVGGVDPGATFTIFDADSNQLNQNNSNAAEFLSEGWYYCYVNNPDGCIGIDSIFLDQPDSLYFSIDSNNPLCNGSNDGEAWIDQVTNAQGPYTVSWNGQVTGSDTITTLMAGAHTVTLVDSVGCTAQNNFSLVAPPLIVIGQLTGDPSQCRGDDIYPGSGTVSSTASGGTGTLTYLWTNGTDTSITNTWGNRVPGWYYLTVTDVNGCSVNDSVYVDSLNPIADFTANPDFGYAPLTVTITDNSAYRKTNSWIFNDSIQNSVVVPFDSLQTPYDSIFVEEAVHSICLIVSNDYECYDTLCQQIQANPTPVLDIPNVVTPNGDGMNDVWNPFQNNGLASVNCIIMNRWGNKVFEITDLNTGFEGKDLNGKVLSDGVYSIIYEAVGLDQVEYKGQGFVHVIRNQ